MDVLIDLRFQQSSFFFANIKQPLDYLDSIVKHMNLFVCKRYDLSFATMKKKIIFILVIVFIGIQFIRPPYNKGFLSYPTDINLVYPSNSEISVLLRDACYDCHSNHTKYPWYANIQPVYWWMNNHIVEGKSALNFSEFGNYDLRKQKKKLIEIAREVTEQKMPLESYTWTHESAKLDAESEQKIIKWANEQAKIVNEKIIYQN
jgi:hypothetical protein